MNYNHARAFDFLNVDYSMLDASIRETLSEALTLPRDTDYAKHFNLEELTESCRTHGDIYGPQGKVLSGKLAAVRWLWMLNRETADAEFPDFNLEDYEP